MKVSFKTLGCKVNQAETQEMIRSLVREGIDISDDEPDFIVVNTCTVTGEADHKSRKAIRHVIKSRKSGAKVIVTGCYARVTAGAIKSIPGVYMVNTDRDKDTLIMKLIDMKADTGFHGLNHETEAGEGSVRQRIRDFIKVQDGCDNACTYCIVPRARGASRSRPADRVISEIEKLVKNVSFNVAADPTHRVVARSNARHRDEAIYGEVILTGINLGKYSDDGLGLVGLLKRIMDIPGLGRVRLSSIEPEDIDDDLLDVMANGIRDKAYICRHLHIPLQSGDDTILKAMARTYTSKDYARLISKIGKSVPGIAITTDVIVGFPGETVEQFDNTCRLVKELGLARLHVFKYSPRPDTQAASLSGRLTNEESNRRSSILRDIGSRLEQAFKESQAGETLDVLVERKTNNMLTGLTDNYIRVNFKGPALKIGKISKVVL
jgi:threonylcarbamoyladenosine tRNA methylthiotransferase MtaB